MLSFYLYLKPHYFWYALSSQKQKKYQLNRIPSRTRFKGALKIGKLTKIRHNSEKKKVLMKIKIKKRPKEKNYV